MTDATAAATTGGDASAGATAATTAAPSTGAATTGAGEAGGNQPWFSGIQNPDLRGYAELKGWTGMDAAIESYRNLEKLNGREKLVMPKDDADTDGWNAVYERLGRPKSAEEYGIKVAEGQDGTRVNLMTQVMHELGVSTKQARGMVEAMAKFETQQAETAKAAYAQKTRQELNDLQQAWGANYDKYAAAGQRAVHQLGFDREQVVGLEKTLGTAGFMEMMANIGLNFAEDTFEGDDNNNAFNSLESAKAQKKMLMDDQDFVRRYNDGEVSAREQMRKLNEAISHHSGNA